MEVENDVRNNRTKTIIESYAEQVGFDEVKRLVHSLIDRIDIHHTNETKSGFFTIRIKYKHYEEYSIFATNWMALRWNWASYYRGSAITEDDLEADYQLAKFLANKNFSHHAR